MNTIKRLPYLWDLFWESFVGGGYKMVLEGLGYTLMIATLGLVIGVVIGTVIAIVHVMPKYKKLPRVLDRICNVYVAFFRGTPIVVQLLLGYYVILPLLGMKMEPEYACVIIFGLNSGAYASEIMRAGITSVDKGQLEAARALGMGYWVSMLKVVLPQAIKNILPTLGNEYISLIKETSVVSFVAASDIYKAFQKIGDERYEYLVPYLAMAVVYIVLVLGITGLLKLMERRLKQGD